jgi:hypothetical protein
MVCLLTFRELSVNEIDALWRCSRDILQAACQQIASGTTNDVYSLKAGFVQVHKNLTCIHNSFAFIMIIWFNAVVLIAEQKK